jgi:hypothetical protein
MGRHTSARSVDIVFSFDAKVKLFRAGRLWQGVHGVAVETPVSAKTYSGRSTHWDPVYFEKGQRVIWLVKEVQMENSQGEQQLHCFLII